MNDHEIIPGLPDLPAMLDLPASTALAPDLRAAVLRAARQVPVTQRHGPPVGVALEPYRSETARLHDLLQQVRAERRWDVIVPATDGWTVGDLVAHLTAVDALLLSGLAPGPDEGPFEVTGTIEEILVRTEAARREARSLDPADVLERWWTQVQVIDEQILAAGPTLLDRAVPFGGRQLPVRHALVDRAFETWIHADDVRAVTGRPPVPPRPSDLAIMTDAAVESLRAALRRAPGAGPTGLVRLVLTGTDLDRVLPVGAPARPGGPAEGRTPGGPGAGPVQAPDGQLTADAVRFCRLFADRAHPDDFVDAATGDRDLVRVVLDTAAALSRP